MQSRIAVERAGGLEALKYLLLGMRPRQWIKNAFVFAGIVFAERHLFTEAWALGRVVLAFALFSLVSGAVYLMNDLADLEQDRLHPRKRHRPLPSGRLAPGLARAGALIFGLGSPALPWLIGLLSGPSVAHQSSLAAAWQLLYQAGTLGWYAFGVVLLLYLLLQIAYTFWLKHVVILDLFCIAGGFVLRAVGGAAILQVTITPWWLMCVLLLALFLGLGKRRNELMVLDTNAANHRRILNEYSPQLLEHLITIVVACTIFAYSYATFSAPSVPKDGFPWLMLTIPFVIYALFRYLYLVYQRGEGGTPEELLLRDRPLLIAILAWGALVLTILLLAGNGLSASG
ncbi:decaprenyl-phosphate phosphoribosyltransferase [Kallotenue papyrolyticum]|uniref:decaprenyl-phosphate phosphoribosyltransferase n=1 Tax=Kallotenue papyrolyticum TaxID=1325125 RepID=UPI0004785A34|nr:decaprenyl-phosphate phosphoribosyltransferase [Kallotenue papyrolyticum]